MSADDIAQITLLVVLYSALAIGAAAAGYDMWRNDLWSESEHRTGALLVLVAPVWPLLVVYLLAAALFVVARHAWPFVRSIPGIARDAFGGAS